MIRIINGKLGPASSVTLRCDCCGHTVRVSILGKVPTNGSLIDGQGAKPAPALHVEDLGYPEPKGNLVEAFAELKRLAGPYYNTSQQLAIQVELEAMKAANAERDRRGEAQAYPEQAFRDLLAKAKQVQASGLKIAMLSEAERQSCKEYTLSFEVGYMGTGANPEHTLSEAGKRARLDESEAAEAHARRVAAALAAVEGISTEALESGAIANLIKVAGSAVYFVCMDQPEYGQLQRALDRLKPAKATAPEAVAKLPVTK